MKKSTRRDPVERFWSRVNKTSGCWLWTGGGDGHGYGLLTTWSGERWVSTRAHRFSYEICVGPIPAGLVIDHLCRTPACVRPDHLEPVTQAVNVQRGKVSALREPKTHCPKNHALTPDNIIPDPSGRRRACKACKREIDKRPKTCPNCGLVVQAVTLPQHMKTASCIEGRDLAAEEVAKKRREAAMRALRAAGATHQLIADQFGISRGHVAKVTRGALPPFTQGRF